MPISVTTLLPFGIVFAQFLLTDEGDLFEWISVVVWLC